MMGVQVPVNEAMEKGKSAHKVIQDHCLGIKTTERLSDFDWKFSKAEHHAMMPYNDKFTLHGYIDMINYKSKVIAEIKTGTPWSQSKFYKTMQWKYYSYVTGFRKILMVTCRFDLSEFKTFYAETSDADIAEAKKWAEYAITGIDKGIFKTDLDENGFCRNDRCPYGELCKFK